MISINKGLAIAVLTLAVGVGCSDNNTVNSLPQEVSQAAIQPSNPVTMEKQNPDNTDNSQTSSSQQQPLSVDTPKVPQKQSVAPSNSTNTDNSPTNSSQNQPVEAKVDYLKPVNDTFIIPGKRIGLITADTTRADLVELYGETNLKDDVVLRGEGTVSFPVTKVNSTTPGALTIFWTDKNRSKISHVSGFGRQWKMLDGGVGVGTSMSGLREILDEFQLTGFGWDNGGFVYIDGTKLSKYKDKLALRLSPDENSFAKHQKQYSAVSGDSIFSSVNPNFKPLDVRVSQMVVTFDKNISPDML
ncbi:hypothetical protein [Calothrix sp. CCY 0018]|uniref:hypothetical protein n=1 Tax=Calothrix sp. CCY 0018 TaxID=3103864 RepID=UPI0039C760EC